MPKTLAFTICSVNYLAQAKILSESLQKTNPDFEFFIGLCDTMEGREIDKSKIEGLNILEVDKIGIEAFDDMCERYDITELNTAVKPFYFNYFLTSRPDVDNFYYIDPDIEIFDKFTGIEASLSKYDIVLTPHFCTPVYDNYSRTEQEMFVNGIYNLGFLAVKRSKSTSEFMNWWMIKLRTECYMDIQKGMFVDQLYCNMVPLYFDNVFIEKSPAYNIAYWNLHERTVSEKNGKYFVNGEPLIFYHYSGMNANDPNNISRWQDRFDIAKRPDLAPLFKSYREQLESFSNTYFKTFKCVYAKGDIVIDDRSFLKKALMSISYRVFAFFERLPI
ncbi:glycosyl transferase [Arcticibacterium luteifluviistationis]|uniref:Glycosyl transferase n=1 Tax=Arcticibacterium luteifluviistationis TaxID=1784714 RepID=A0A2Z4GDY4_9BACT|nr:glycosyl transferase [Arcticibacterium luteifluviistationis]AWV99360.1 glycosyl transferase [Arcticibacterium luteifluviistationis]